MNIKQAISLQNPLRKLYHLLRGISAYLTYGNPAKHMVVIGVTGTKGKSSTCHFIASGLQAAGKNVCMFSTASLLINNVWTENPYKMTSPDPFTIQKFLKTAYKQGVEYAVIEVSSHALYYNRFYGIDFDVALFTNLSQDHLDLHGTMETYAQTKLQLFTGLSFSKRKPGVKKVTIVNVDSEYSKMFLEAVADVQYTFGTASHAQIRPLNIQTTQEGVYFDVRMPSHTFQVRTPLVGNFQVSNILGAIAVLISQGVSLVQIVPSIASVTGIPGRMQSVPIPLAFKVIVDYAHTEESLKQVLATCVEILQPTKKLILVFGATGNRDRTKRAKMGAVADKYAHSIILTEDDNYSEPQFQIMNEVSQGIKRKEGENFWIIFHREDAIRTALLLAQEGDIVLLCGKGSETTIVRNSGSEPWSDYRIASDIASEIQRNSLFTLS